MIPLLLQATGMTRNDKLLRKVKENPRNVSLEEFEALIKINGYIKEGSKHPAARIGNYTMPYRRENPIKACYVKELLRISSSVEIPMKKRRVQRANTSGGGTGGVPQPKIIPSPSRERVRVRVKKDYVSSLVGRGNRDA